MPLDPTDLARRLAAMETRLRKELYEELRGHEEDLESIFDPYSYSPLVHELRDKYLSRLYLIHGILQQLAHYSQSRSKHGTRVVSVEARSQPELVQLVNRKLEDLNGSKVQDVTFIPAAEDNWSALITYQMNPFAAEADEKAPWM